MLLCFRHFSDFLFLFQGTNKELTDPSNITLDTVPTFLTVFCVKQVWSPLDVLVVYDILRCCMPSSVGNAK